MYHRAHLIYPLSMLLADASIWIQRHVLVALRIFNDVFKIPFQDSYLRPQLSFLNRHFSVCCVYFRQLVPSAIQGLRDFLFFYKFEIAVFLGIFFFFLHLSTLLFRTLCLRLQALKFRSLLFFQLLRHPRIPDQPFEVPNFLGEAHVKLLQDAGCKSQIAVKWGNPSGRNPCQNYVRIHSILYRRQSFLAFPKKAVRGPSRTHAKGW
mmetsp:Transcript_2996/g.4695  ORF Transcript_2996/g.4695 Transcript_2996/m.4695 type:complete len:207 (-) Transcript_2996:322-942(-)